MNSFLVQLTLRRWAEIYSDPRIYILFFMFIVSFTVISPLGFEAHWSLYDRFVVSVMSNAICWPIALMINPPVRISLEQVGIRSDIALMAACIVSGLTISPLLLWVLQNEISSLPTRERIIELIVFICFLCWVTGYGLMRRSFAQKPLENPSEKMTVLDSEAKPERTMSPKCMRLLERISPDKRGPIYAMVAQDHYVEIITNKGSELILMRLSDAIAMCENHNCLRIHRSAWISIDGLRELKKEGRRMLVVMQNGRELPVSRSSEGKLKKFLMKKGLGKTVPA